MDGEARWDDPTHANTVSVWDIGADEYVDADADGLPDSWELQHWSSITNQNASSDGDAERLCFNYGLPAL